MRSKFGDQSQAIYSGNKASIGKLNGALTNHNSPLICSTFDAAVAAGNAQKQITNGTAANGGGPHKMNINVNPMSEMPRMNGDAQLENDDEPNEMSRLKVCRK